ncbi:N-acetylmuramoyl-L-alanine amidase [Gordonia sp. DT101]|uniref:N-acetylmuramoyl-L-alanine amidase n=1 Tax=Gordonia sp. DT101 TaxID=3416545 RepID=UPI003CFA8F4A
MSWTGDPIWLADVLRAEGLKVVEHAGWKQRGHGDFRDIRGIICHHTAGGGASDWVIVQNGRSDLPGPLAQLVLERDGAVRVIAAGVCWHAGRGSWSGWPTNNANYHTIGIEAVNNGVGQPWPAVQLDAYKRVCKAIAKRVGFGANMIAGHKEYSSEGKIDPFGIDMPSFRADVAKMLATPDAPIENKINTEATIAKQWIGKRLFVDERVCKDGIGRYVDFEHGSIYWHPQVHKSNAIAVPAHIYDIWKTHQWEQGYLGYPIKRHTVITGVGDIQAFQGGTVYRRYGRPGYAVRGVIGKRWATEGFEAGPLGWPTSDEYDHDGGKRQDFDNGHLEWHPSGAVREVTA